MEFKLNNQIEKRKIPSVWEVNISLKSLELSIQNVSSIQLEIISNGIREDVDFQITVISIFDKINKMENFQQIIWIYKKNQMEYVEHKKI